MKKTSKTPHFYFAQASEEMASILISREHDEYNHIKNVLRLKTDDALEIVNGKGLRLNGVIQSISKDAITISIREKEFQEKPAFQIDLFQPPLKPSRMDWMLEKIAELGVAKYHPLVSENSLLKTENKNVRIDRWQRILVSGMKQSKSLYLPQIQPLLSLDQCLENIKEEKYHCLLLASLASKGRFFADVLQQEISKNRLESIKIAVAIGPEGGFSAEEEKKFISARFIPTSIGYTVLRAETASIVCAALAINLIGASS